MIRYLIQADMAPWHFSNWEGAAGCRKLLPPYRPKILACRTLFLAEKVCSKCLQNSGLNIPLFGKILMQNCNFEQLIDSKLQLRSSNFSTHDTADLGNRLLTEITRKQSQPAHLREDNVVR